MKLNIDITYVNEDTGEERIDTRELEAEELDDGVVVVRYVSDWLDMVDRVRNALRELGYSTTCRTSRKPERTRSGYCRQPLTTDIYGDKSDIKRELPEI